ncbi:MAG: 8-oxo-dGTP diphosphatase [Saprospiraceae bacterium]|nr:8-oxo-dGTP diphosphatase [Saprospiraceae bacterium]
MKKIAVMVILRCGNHYLLLERVKAPNAGKFVPVGGKLEAHESPVEAAVRETREETGISIALPKLCGILSETSPVDYNWLCYIYLADIPFQEPPPCDEGRLVWIAGDQLDAVPTPPTDLAIYDYVHRGEHFILDARYDSDMNLYWMYDELLGRIVIQNP